MGREVVAAAPCIECGRRAKALPRQRCATCLLRHEPVGEQVKAARLRLAMVPPDMRMKLTKVMREAAPVGTRWCAGCQSYRDEADFRGERQTQCWACRSAKSHAAMTERVYGLSGEQYDALLELQGGGCAVCGGKPKSKRLAVDHDHKTGAVRGLLCKRHNKDALGSLHDSIAQVTALWHYLNTPPASGDWAPISNQPPLTPDGEPERPSDALGIVTASGREISGGANVDAPSNGFVGIPVGAETVPGKRGVWRYYVEPDGDPPF